MTDDPIRHSLAETTLAADLRTWRRAHPDATLTEIERELDTRLAAARAELFAQLATEGATDAGCCPDCWDRWSGGERARRPCAPPAMPSSP